MKILVFFLSLCCFPSFAAEKIIVGGYFFPPFVEFGVEGKLSGLTFDLIEELNKAQDKYQFEFFLTSPKRRYQDFKKGRFDALFFEMKIWGWKTIAVDESDVFFQGGEVYIAKRTAERGQEFFDNLSKKTIAGVLGYHYGVFGFESDEIILRDKFGAVLTSDHERSIVLVAKGRVDVAIVTESYLKRYFRLNPELEKDILASKKRDQVYEHTILLRKNGKIHKDEINKLLADLTKQDYFQKIRAKYGMD